LRVALEVVIDESITAVAPPFELHAVLSRSTRRWW
jgi:hypothetical protein